MTKLNPNWPNGPWDAEPDRRFWLTKTGLPAYILRQPICGHLCGYVQVPDILPPWGEPWDVPVTVHGGVSWYGPTSNFDGTSRPEVDCNWVGFDCNHASDFAPGLAGYYPQDQFPEMTYLTIGSCEEQCESLARQLRALELEHIGSGSSWFR